MWYFVRCWLGMAVGIVLGGLGIHWQSVAVQVIGGFVTFAAFLGMLSTIGRANSARCPSCSATMTQGWDAKQQSSDGVFTCPNCQSRWRTSATWGSD
jgi:DNA-directed RNA polymerase subunit RPC12/RpoP